LRIKDAERDEAVPFEMRLDDASSRVEKLNETK
jgi:hypothetical protein